MATDPIAKLRSAGRSVSSKTRAEVLARGPAVIPRLVDLLDEADGWAAIHAVDLLVDLKAAEAVGPMLRVLDEVDLDDELSSRVIIRLPELGSAVLEPALELLAASEDENTVWALCEVLAKLGVRDERVFGAVCKLFEDNEMLGAGLLADYGDERALPLVDRALADFEPDFSELWGRGDLLDLLDARERLGGELMPQDRERVDGWLAEWDAQERRSKEAPARKRKVGRNDPCPCESGKKYKKCCLMADEAERPRVGEADV
jgi:SEC-C motif